MISCSRSRRVPGRSALPHDNHRWPKLRKTCQDVTYDSSSCYQEGGALFKEEEKQTSPSQVCFSSWQGIFQPLVIALLICLLFVMPRSISAFRRDLFGIVHLLVMTCFWSGFVITKNPWWISGMLLCWAPGHIQGVQKGHNTDEKHLLR